MAFKKRRKIFVEIKTNRHGWRKVRLLKVKSHKWRSDNQKNFQSSLGSIQENRKYKTK